MMRRHAGLTALAWALLLALTAGVVGDARGDDRAGVHVSGLGVLSDHAMTGRLKLILGSQRGRTLDASAIEDAGLVLFSTLTQRGYLDAKLTVEVVEQGGRVETFPLDAELNQPLPRRVAATRVEYRVRRGHRFTVKTVAFTGLTALKLDTAVTYFRGQGLFAAFTDEEAYSPDRVRRGMGNLLTELRRQGYVDATVTAAETKIDHATARVDLTVDVHQGAKYIVKSLEMHVTGNAPSPPANLEEKSYGRPWSSWWQHDAELDVQRWYFRRGRPDVRVRLTPRAEPEAGGERAVVAVADVQPGEAVRVGQIRFEGNTRTRTSVLKPLVTVKPGDPLDPRKLEDDEYKISRLGVFSSVELKYDPAQGPVRDAVYDLAEGKKQDVDLLAGWGSFEELRGGVEWRDYDLFNLAHEGTFKFVQSVKSTEGEYDYTIPELFGTSTDATAKAFGFDRDERSFHDEQLGLNLSASTPLPGIGWELLAGYTFERLENSQDTLATGTTALTSARLADIQFALTRDKRDNPLLPRHGYKVSIQGEEAARQLGSAITFQQFEFQASYHTQWGHSRWLHFGLSHSVLTTYGAALPPGELPSTVLPPNVFFYPGGQDSIRGYGMGQAAPRDPATNAYLPAVAATVFNAELEQALTSKWSAVIFSDTLGATESMTHYPWDYRLYSVGFGFRYDTLVGPIRLEYGRNLNPRPQDPQGTVQFSVGFPF